MAQRCVRVDPPVIKFNNVEVGQVHKIKVTATNVGRNSKKIIFEMPPSKLFKFTQTSTAVVVVPGLSVSGLLEFSPETEEHVTNGLLIHIDTGIIEVPILVFPRACCLKMNPVVDFGCVAAISQIISKYHTINNQGSAPGTFQVQGSGDPSIKITPSNGVVPAGATQWIKVELRTDRSRQIDENILVKLQNHTSVALNIRAKVVDPHLQICDLQGAPLSCLWFGPVYFGTSNVEKIILRNSAPQACDWVCVVQDSVSGTEFGTNLQRSTTADTPLLDGMQKCSHVSKDAAQVFMCFPKQGRLGPYDKTTVTLCFSPVCKSYSSRRQDYCLFLLFESVSSKHGFTRHTGSTGVELAVTGSGLPVSLIPSPSQNFNFLTCVTGQRVDLLCALKNHCPQLPVNFRFRKLPHFSTYPSTGTITPGQCQNIVLSFNPRQQGTFHMLQKVDVLGHVSQQGGQNTSEEFAGLQLCTFYTVTLHLSAVCRSETTQSLPKLTHGIYPIMNNAQSNDLSCSREMVPAASLGPDKMQLYEHHKVKIRHSKSKNSKGQSTRSPTSHRQCRTICTKLPRQRYVDSSDAFTEHEKEQRQQHCQIYADLFKQQRQTRLQKLQQRQQQTVENDVDIGIVPSQGLMPPKLRCKDFEKSIVSLTKSKSFKTACDNSTSIPQQITNEVSTVIKAVPSTSQEVAECSRSLTAQELYQVIIGPLLVDFGEVCVQSVCVQTLEIINHLSVHVWVQLEVDCPELQGSSPVSHVLPPQCHTALTLTFQNNKLGEFYRTVPYTVNKKHPGQILVQAKVVPVALELSTDLVVLHPTPTLLARSGYRSSVTLKNRRNHAAEFTWKPVVTENGILHSFFSIRPAAGVVEAYKELDCEVVWHASFSSLLEGDFDLCVPQGNKQRLHCLVKVGCTRVQLAEKKRVTFESVPLNMTSVKTAVLHNTGPNHAFYQVLDVCPLPGMVVSPTEGMVPRGGQAVINIHFNPDSVFRFDRPVEIALKGMESVKLRMGGSVEPPNVEMSVSSFQLYGVYLGSQRSVPFFLTNHSSAPARVTFDLSEHTDFSVQLPEFSIKPVSSMTVVEIEANQKVNCSLVFCPTQVASHDFDLPMTVNGVIISSAFHFSFPPSPPTCSTSCSLTFNSSKATIRPVPPTVSMETGSRHVKATVLCAPLEMSPSSLHFNLALLADTYLKTVTLKAEPEGKVCWSSLMKPHISWWIDCSAVKKCTIDEEDAVCTVSPSSGRLGPDQYICLAVIIKPEGIRRVSGTVTKLTLPLYLGDKLPDGLREEEGLQPYRELSITIHHLPSITVHPSQLLLTPVPLGCNMVATLSLVATGYTSGTHITAEISDVEQENRTKQLPLSLTFPQGTQISAEDLHKKHVDIFNNEATSLICNVSFCSHTPLTLSSTITFSDHLQNKVKVKVWAVADNCLLTVWPYLALHRSEQQIVLKAGPTAVEAVLQNFDMPSLGSCQTFSSSSAFDHSSSINLMSGTDSFPGSIGVSGQPSSDRAFSSYRETPVNCGVPEFHAPKSEQGLYYQRVLVAVERWFSLFGWVNGPHPISVPHTLRRVASKIQTNHPSGRTQNKSSRSVVDMLIHLTGKQVPGIPHSQSISDDIRQRTTQLIQQYKAILEFLKVQGACLCYVRPEYLLDKNEFNHWRSLQLKESDNSMDYSSVDYESMSKRSWTDLLLRIYKVFVLCRVSVKDKNTAPACMQPLASNVYSGSELQLLSWLNMNYESTRKTVWSTEDAPSARWIVNFDLDLTDGLVLAAVLATYCPYLICSHFKRMYTKPDRMEQILHNNIIVVQALTTLSLNIDIYPTDFLDPNPVQMLMLCVHLNKKLPQYQPTQTITLSGELHSIISKQVHLKSPTSKPIKYKALLLGEDAHLFSLPGGLSFTIPAKGSTKLTIEYSCAFLRPKEAALLLFSSSTFGTHGALTFHLKTYVTHISPTQTVKCSSPCYKLKLIQLPIINPFQKDGNFKVMLLESMNNPLETEKQQATSESNPLVQKMTDKTCFETEGTSSDPDGEEDSEFSCAERSIFLESGQADTLDIDYLPFSPGNKYCSVLLTCPQVGDVVYMVNAAAELPLPLPFTAKPSQNIIPSDDECVSVLSLRCKVGQICQEIICLPIINMAWEQALAIWGQRRMSADELRRRSLTHTLHSSSVRAATAAQKLGKQQCSEAFLTQGGGSNKGLQYSVEVCMPQYLSLPSTVTIPVNANVKMPWENPADCGCVEIPLRFQADSVGRFTCKMVLRSWCDTRVYMLEAMVTTMEESSHLDFSTPAHHSVTQYIPLHNERDQDLKIQAEVFGEGFSGPEVFTVAAGTKACYPLTFHPATQRIVMGKLTLLNDFNGTEHVFTLRGVGERPLAVDHLLLHCPVRKSTKAQLNVPNYTKTKLSLKVETDLSFVSGPAYLKVKPSETAPYTLTISPWKRGTQKGCVLFVETDKQGHFPGDEGRYEVYFTLEIICDPTEPVKIINAQCAIQSNVAIEIPINNPHEEHLDLDVFLEGDGLCGEDQVSLPPHETLTYKAIFSPRVVGKGTGSVVFQSVVAGEFWYRLDLYALPLPVVMLPETCCQLGKWTRLFLPLVNPTSEPVELTVFNSNPRNYALEMDSENTLILEPHSSTQLGVHFSPSSIGEGNHRAKITFSCPQLQEWSFSLSGCGLNPECEEPVNISSKIGSNASICIPFTNPTELQAVLNITLTDKNPKVDQNTNSGAKDRNVFTIAMIQTEGVQIDAGSSIDVPVVFTPTSMEIQKAWLCITMTLPSNNSTFTTSSKRSAQDLSTICWIYPLCGIPTEVPVENPPLGIIQCEAGCQLEKKVVVLLAGCVLGNQEVSQVIKEDFLCEVRSEREPEHLDVEDCLSASVESATKDPDSGIIKLTLHLIYSPLKPCKSQYKAVLTVKCVSGGSWEFPVTLISTKPVFDDVIHIEAPELGKTSAVGFRLTSTTRRPEPFTAALLAGSSGEFTVTPASGMLPPIDPAGLLITVSFTPSSYNKKSRARLQIKAADMQWTYEVKGNPPQNFPSLINASDEPSSSIVHSVKNSQKNFVVHNLHIPGLANSSPLKIRR